MIACTGMIVADNRGVHRIAHVSGAPVRAAVIMLDHLGDMPAFAAQATMAVPRWRDRAGLLALPAAAAAAIHAGWNSSV